MKLPDIKAFFSELLPSGSLHAMPGNDAASLAGSSGWPPLLLALVLVVLLLGAGWLLYRAAHSAMLQQLRNKLLDLQGLIERYQRDQLRLQMQSAHDDITGAFSRSTILEMLNIEADRSRRLNHSLSALLVTVDHASTLQQHYGIDALHAVQAEVVKQCRAHVRTFDLIGRYNADEFIVLLAEIDRPVAEAIARRLHNDVAQNPLEFEGTRIGYTITIAYHSLAARHCCPVTLLERCQQALKQARNSGTSQVACA